MRKFKCKVCGKRVKRSGVIWLTSEQIEYLKPVLFMLIAQTKKFRQLCTYCDFDLRCHCSVDYIKMPKKVNK